MKELAAERETKLAGSLEVQKFYRCANCNRAMIVVNPCGLSECKCTNKLNHIHWHINSIHWDTWVGCQVFMDRAHPQISQTHFLFLTQLMVILVALRLYVRIICIYVQPTQPETPRLHTCQQLVDAMYDNWDLHFTIIDPVLARCSTSELYTVLSSALYSIMC